MSGGITLDAGALIALERRKDRAWRVIRVAHAQRRAVTVPVVAIAEWWRARTDDREAILGAVLVEPMDVALARAAGAALAALPRATLADAIVAASAARRGDVVVTSDPDDLLRLTAHFTSLRVLGI